MTLKLYSPENREIVGFERGRDEPFICTAGYGHAAGALHTAEVIEVYVAGVCYENPDAPPRQRAVMEITGDDIGKIKPDFYTVYTISNTDTPTRAESDHNKLEKAILAGAELARKLGLPLNLRISPSDSAE